MEEAYLFDSNRYVLIDAEDQLFLFYRSKRKIMMNIEPSRKIESSFRLMSKGSWGSGIMEMTSQAGKLKDSASPWRFDAVSIAQISAPSSIPSRTRYQVLELVHFRLFCIIPVLL